MRVITGVQPDSPALVLRGRPVGAGRGGSPFNSHFRVMRKPGRNWIILLWRLEVPSSWQAGDLLAKQSYEVLSLKFQSESEGLRTRDQRCKF